MLDKGTASLEVKNSERNRKLENFASLRGIIVQGEDYVLVLQMEIIKLLIFGKEYKKRW